jgi:hypothetical protein
MRFIAVLLGFGWISFGDIEVGIEVLSFEFDGGDAVLIDSFMLFVERFACLFKSFEQIFQILRLLHDHYNSNRSDI